MQYSTQAQIEKMIRDIGEPSMIGWADVMKYARTKVRFGEITLTLRDGYVDKIEWVKEVYKPNKKEQ